MAEVVLFHHAHGLTDGVDGFADALRAAGHTVTVPDLYEGATFDTVDEGVAHAESIGFDAIMERGVAAATASPGPAVYAGFSLGVMPAQRLAQTHPDARGALLYHAAVPLGYFGDAWPGEVPAQIHIAADDEDTPVAEELAGSGAPIELFLYPGTAHLFTDAGLADYDDAATALVLERSLRFLGELS
jgi:dienelactone hydrolase